MAEIIRMPLLSDTMTEGVIVKWNKKVGDSIKSDDAIAEVETDKATMDVVPYMEGTLLYVAGKEGDTIPVNGLMAIIGKKGEDFQSILDAESKKGSAPKTSTAKSADNAPAPVQVATESVANLPSPNDATVVRMPLMSDTMTEGTLVTWLKKVGDSVASDEAIAEIETDKATMEMNPYMDGTLLYVALKEGESAKVNAMIAIIGKKGTDVSGLVKAEQNKDSQTAGSTAKPVVTQTTASPTAAQTTSPINTSDNSASKDANGRIKVSPLARRMAKEKGINLADVIGTGEEGRIIKRDIEQYKPSVMTAAVSNGVAMTESYEDIPLSQMRKTVARRLTESKFSAPHFYLRMSIQMDEAIKARKAMNEVSPVKISFNDLVIKACAMALRKHPAVNSSFMGDFIRQNHHISVGTAVAVPEGLIVPVIKFTDTKSLSQIAEEAKSLIEKARNKKLQPPEFTGNTFTISNLGMMDIDEFTAIINPPDSCILAVGKIKAEPVVEEGEIVVRQIMQITLSCDHRVVDGAKGAAFLQTVKTYLEHPVTMLV